MRVKFLSYFNRWVALASLFIALVLCGLCFLSFLVFLPAENSQGGFSTAVFTLIPFPTDTPMPTETPTPAPEAASTRASQLFIGAQVLITGTGGEGLNVRSAPGVDNTSRFLGAENEILQVKDGPVSKDGYTWWYLETPNDKERSGWAVEAFLQIEAGQ